MTTLILDAFGQLSVPRAIDGQEDDLYNVFSARAELMGWGRASSAERPLFWTIEEAELNPDLDPGATFTEFVFAPNCIGFVQVGLDVAPLDVHFPPSTPGPARSGWYGYKPDYSRSSDPVLALPPLMQCFHDSLSRFGNVELSGLQVTARNLETGAASQRGRLVSVLNWFNTNMESQSDTIVSFDHGLLEDLHVPELVASLQYWNTGSFDFKSVVDTPDHCKAKTTVESTLFPALPLSSLGVSVTMPEWTPSSVGWTLASVLDTARAINPDASDFALRITRV